MIALGALMAASLLTIELRCELHSGEGVRGPAILVIVLKSLKIDLEKTEVEMLMPWSEWASMKYSSRLALPGSWAIEDVIKTRGWM